MTRDLRQESDSQRFDSQTLSHVLGSSECSESVRHSLSSLPETLADISVGVSQLRHSPSKRILEEFGGSDSLCVVCWGAGIAGHRAWRRGREGRKLACRQTNFSKLVVLPGVISECLLGCKIGPEKKMMVLGMECCLCQNGGAHHDSLQLKLKFETHDELGFGFKGLKNRMMSKARFQQLGQVGKRPKRSQLAFVPTRYIP